MCLMVTYRALKKKDIRQIQDLALKAWMFTYRNIYKKDTIQREVAEFYSDKNFENFLTRIKQKKDCFVVAISKSKMIGYAHVGLKNNKWELFRIYLNPSYIGKGVGSKLINYIEKFLKSKKAKKYIVYPHARNKIAITFYYKAGFQRAKLKDRSKSSLCFEKNI